MGLRCHRQPDRRRKHRVRCPSVHRGHRSGGLRARDDLQPVLRPHAQLPLQQDRVHGGSQGPVDLVYAVGHLHVGGLSLDLYDDATGELICHSAPTYGTGLEAGNEAHYLTGMSDCVFDPPLKMKRETVVRTIARYNNTVAHHGVMALWLMQVADPTPASASTLAT